MTLPPCFSPRPVWAVLYSVLLGLLRYVSNRGPWLVGISLGSGGMWRALYPGEDGWAGNRAAVVSETSYKLSRLGGNSREMVAWLLCSWQPCTSSGFVLSVQCSPLPGEAPHTCCSAAFLGPHFCCQLPCCAPNSRCPALWLQPGHKLLHPCLKSTALRLNVNDWIYICLVSFHLMYLSFRKISSKSENC